MEEKLRELCFVKGHKAESIYFKKQCDYKSWAISIIIHDNGSDIYNRGLVINHPVHGIWERTTECELHPCLDDEIFEFFAKHLIDKLGE